MTGVGNVGLAEGSEAKVALANDVGNAIGPSMKWSVGKSDGNAVGRMTSPASAEQAQARAQSARLRLMASG